MSFALRAVHPWPPLGLGAVNRIHPLEDPRWAEFVDKHPRSSVFHSPPWLDALRRTYGYQPLAYTLSPPDGQLEDALVLCRVESWITGRRLVSLPFSDHCEPLVDDAADEIALVAPLEQALLQEKLRYIEVRAGRLLPGASAFYRSGHSYCLHKLDLLPDLGALFEKCHKSSTQRKILRAQREGLTCETGRSAALLDAFWGLHLMTRRRHHVPPQPRNWFRNLIDCFGDALQIRVAFMDRQPVAAILTLRHRDALVYKYGASDPRFNNLGGTHLLFWRSIKEAKAEGLRVFDLGRTDWDNTGLITFKDRWGATRSNLSYTRFSIVPSPAPFSRGAASWADRIARRAISYLPDRVLCLIGTVLYKHIA